ncbi:MAG: tRNA glutamyl-Q(34) synthetase GluQRS [Sulfuricella sp.]
MKTEVSPHRGRFAPSPTGPLHFGSLVAAVGSFLDAKSRHGEWLVRIEDLDPPRIMAGAADAILRTLEALDLHWDGAVMYQSRRGDAYREALDQLQRQGALYPCNCSRREIADSTLSSYSSLVYPGYCRNGMRPGRTKHALRVRTDDVPIQFHDRLLGHRSQRLAAETGDFVLRRADGLYAYQLAVVVDDAEQGVSDIVRGADILDSTPRQIYLQKLLGLTTPSYLHLPVAVNVQGEKLSKQTLAPAVEADVPLPLLFKVLEFLGQDPPRELLQGELTSFWFWAIAHWSVEKIPALPTMMAICRQ